MARGIAKQIEGAFAIVLYVMFLLFFLAAVKIKIIDKINNQQQFKRDLISVDNLLFRIEKPYYLINFSVSIPKAMRDYVCSLSDSTLKRDFCVDFPIYYPLNLSAIVKYSGVVEGDPYSYYDPVDGLFFYTNFSNFTKCVNSDVVKVKVYNPNKINLRGYQIFITSPTIREWLKSGYHLSVTDSNGKTYNFCYHHKDFICNTTPKDAYGIWLKISINPNSSIELIIKKTSSSNSEETDGSKIFVFYDHFKYDTLNDLEKIWVLNRMNCYKISNTEWRCTGNKYNSIMYTNNKYIKSNQGYIIYFKLRNNAYYDEGYSLDDYVGVGPSGNNILSRARFYDNNFLLFNVSVDENSKIFIYDEDYGTYDNYLNFTIDYIIIKKQAEVEPLIKIIQDGDTCNKNFQIIVGPYIRYDNRSDIGFKAEYTSITYGNTIVRYYNRTIFNKYLIYKYYIKKTKEVTHNIITIIITIYNYSNLYDIFSNFFYFKNLFFLNTNTSFFINGVLSKNNIAVYYKNAIKSTTYNYIGEMVLFSHSRWFITALDIIPSSFYKYFIVDGEYVSLAPSKATYISEVVDFNYEKLKNNLYLPGGIYTLAFYENTEVNPPRYLILSYNPILSTYYYVYNKKYNQFYSVYKSYFPANAYRNFMLYFYAYNNSISNINNLTLHFILPKIQVKGIQKIYAIPINKLMDSNIPSNAYIYFPIYNKGFGNQDIRKSYSYKVEKLVYVFDSNKDKIVKTWVTIYIK